MDSNDRGLLQRHARANPPCEVQNETPEDDITPAQEELLPSRTGNNKKKDEIELWNAMYKILFPNDYPIPTPCK
jgi:hypothetical protein